MTTTVRPAKPADIDKKWLLIDANGLVLGNQVTPIPVTLDGQAHTVTIPLEAIAADAAAGSTYTLQITDGTTVYFAARSAGATAGEGAGPADGAGRAPWSGRVPA